MRNKIFGGASASCGAARFFFAGSHRVRQTAVHPRIRPASLPQLSSAPSCS